jgi:hypothetical protein
LKSCNLVKEKRAIAKYNGGLKHNPSAKEKKGCCCLGTTTFSFIRVPAFLQLQEQMQSLTG